MVATRDRSRHSGLTERSIDIDGYTTNYAEGPANGPPLVLVHGQGSRWQDHRRVLPELTRHHHVFALDVAGHGRSGRLDPGHYTNARVGARIAAFVEAVAPGPVLVSGHSSGALLALWLAAERPDLVRGLFLEDPPLFSSIAPRIHDTVGGTLPRLAVRYLRDSPDGGFMRHYVAHGDYFAFFGRLAPVLTRYGLRWIDKHPGRPLRFFFLPDLVNVYFEGLTDYDPAFGAAWDDGQWYRDFDTAAALAAVRAPTTLLHTDWWHRKRGDYYADGTLMAAMDGDDTARAVALLPDVHPVTLACGHLVHFERPKAYLEALTGLEARIR